MINRIIAIVLSLVMSFGLLPMVNPANIEAAEIQPAMWFMDDLNISQVPGGDYSHAGTKNFDVIGVRNKNIKAPFDCTIVAIFPTYESGNTVIIQSDAKVKYANGSQDYMSLAFGHDNDISDCYVGKKIKQGSVFYQNGDYGPATGVHSHVTCIKGKYTDHSGWIVIPSTGNSTFSNAIDPREALFISKSTKIYKTLGMSFKLYDENIIPNTPANVKITKTDIGIGDSITANWSASLGASKYKVQLTCTTNSAYSQSTTVGGTSASFSIKNEGTYKVSVSATNAAGTSGSSSSGNCVAHSNVNVKYVDWDDQIIKIQNLKWGANATAPVPPEREGYTFQNWSSDGKGIKSDTTITATYKINSYSVSFVDYKGEIIDRIQKVDYLSSATEPIDVPCKKGYVFAGWSTNEYKEVKKTLTVKATYVWENSDLPIVTEIVNAKRNNEGTGYVIDVNLTNFPDDFTKGKLVVAMMTKSGKMVASETRTISMPETGECSERITVLYSGLASRVQVSMIGVIDDETTGTPKSKITTSAVDIGNEWSDWNPTVPQSNDIITESRIEYRFKDTKVIKATNQPTTPSGYSYVSKSATGTYTSWSGWSSWGWGGSTPSKTSLKDVGTATGYRYYAYKCKNCGARDPYKGECSGCGKTLGDSNWTETYFDYAGTSKSYTKWNSEKGYITVNGVRWNFSIGKQPTITLYHTRTRSEYYNYTYKMSEFSDWQAEKIDSSNTREVETRTVYRFKTNSTEVSCYNYKRYRYTNINNGNVIYTYTSRYADSMEYSGEWEYYRTFAELNKVSTVDDDIELYNGTGEDSWYKADVNYESSSTDYETKDTLEDKNGEARSLEGDIPASAGKVATLLVYKGQNEDPTASQIEYIGQVIISENGHYKFDYITKEEPTTKTGDFIITLGLEGSTNYQVIGKIEAPKQVFTVDFLDDEGNSIGEQKKVVDGGTVDAPKAPEKEGYDFVGWDTGLRNVRENMVVTAEYKKKTYTVIFVDWDSTSLEIKEFDYGDELVADDIPIKEGQTFEKWIDSSNNEVKNVTENMVVEASYKDATYTVIFKDWDGNIISEQVVAYGEQAIVPDDLEAPSDIQVFQVWDKYEQTLRVTEDIIVNPVAKYIEDSKVPRILIEKGSNAKNTVVIYSTISNTDIYYYIENSNSKNGPDNGVEESAYRIYVEPIEIDEDSVVYAFAKTNEMNKSEYVSERIMVSSEQESITTSEQTTVETTPEVTSTTIVQDTTAVPTITVEQTSTSVDTSTTITNIKIENPTGLVGIEDKNGNYNLYWQESTNANYYNVYINGIIVSNTSTTMCQLPASIFTKSDIYTIGVQAVGNSCISEVVTISYEVVVDDTTQNDETSTEIVSTTTEVTTNQFTSAEDVQTTTVSQPTLETTTEKGNNVTEKTNIVLKSQIISTDKIKSYKAKKIKKKKVTFYLKAKTTGNGIIKYQVISYPKKMKKYISVSKAGKVILKRGAKKGKYQIKLIASKTSEYNSAYKIVTIKVK